ncbi:LuxR C-terminal-related transcriptional regulator [Vibrio sp. JC009]|uniref:response regulator transcription factor n=1 Tax=Vibrio sp. JC009 TaxID=2912314 RepID=UPI0023B08A54|nr:LuxR C-terminal-related transcriptional regulator [Vibrio sp. JC009]WED22901.1 LuxR C-terminal-related transcriptional regulator [Vibrio sp. JC009]
MLSFEDQAELSRLIARLYGTANDVSLPDFQRFCFDNLNEKLNVCEGIWFSVRRDEQLTLLSSSYGYNLVVPQMLEQQDATKVTQKELDSLINKYPSLISQQVFDITTEYFQSPGQPATSSVAKNIYLTSDCAFWAINHGDYIDIVGIHSKELDKNLPQEALSFCNLYFEHIIEAKRLNILSSFNRGWVHRNSCRAACDINGYLLHAEAPFLDRMEKLGLGKDHRYELPDLKPEIPVRLSPINGTIIEATKSGSLVYLEVANEAPLPEQLSRRQKQVAKALLKGLSDKQIADELHISKFTASNHLKNIYKLLGVKTRTEAVRKLLAQNS